MIRPKIKTNANKNGFTIVEVSVVIVVIAILSAIVIVGYGAWRNSISGKQVQSDLNGVQSGMEGERNFEDNGYPTFADGTEFDSSSNIFAPSDDVTITYMSGDADSYCIEAKSKVNPAISYFITSANGVKETKPGECPLSTNNGVVTTVVNGGLNQPTGIAVDSAGWLYVAESGNHRILKISPAGAISVFAGSGVAGNLNGTGTAAQFNTPYGVAIDAAGYVYVADHGNHRFRKISPAGVVTTFAGSTPGFLNANGTSAQFNDPHAVAVEQSTGNVYITETANHRVRKITPSGDVTSVAGSSVGNQDGTGAGVMFHDPLGIAIYSDGNLYVADNGNNRIRRVTAPAGVTTTLAGNLTGFTDGFGLSARFNFPTGIGIRDNIAYVADSGNNRVRMVNLLTGEVATLAGSGTAGDVDSTGTFAQFNYPTGIAVSSTDIVYIVEMNSGQIRKVQ